MAPMTRSSSVSDVPMSSSGPNGPQAAGPTKITARAVTLSRTIRPGFDRIPR